MDRSTPSAPTREKSGFILLADEAGLIVPIGQWVLGQNCTQGNAWSDRGFGDPAIAVDVSAQQFRQHDIVATTESAWRSAEFDPARLEIEITESVLMKEAGDRVERLRALRAMWIGIALDDFGTGYSALGYLKKFPITRLKIDQSFVRDLSSDPSAATITSATVGVAQGLGLLVVAEGVEEERQAAVLREQGCNVLQGYLFGKPGPAGEFEGVPRSLAGPGIPSATR